MLLIKVTDLYFLLVKKIFQLNNPDPSEIYDLGTVAMIMRMRKLPDGRIKILVQGLNKARIIDFEQSQPYFITKLEKIEDSNVDFDNVST